MNIGIIGAADIAFRRFLPALTKCADVTFAGVASRTPEKAAPFREACGGRLYSSYDELLADKSVDAVYIPLPPALHFPWGRRALEAGKHLLLEKPFTTCQKDTEELLLLAERKGLAVHENYMFLYHSQLAKIRELLQEGAVGEPRLIRASFGFPKRGADDFRYDRALGGGALLDCGGYPARLAAELLGENARVVQAELSEPPGYEVDLFGGAVLRNDAGLCAQIAFGMDNAYQCRLEVWGSRAMLAAPRIFTPPPEYSPTVELTDSHASRSVALPPDDAFLRSLERFAALCRDPSERAAANDAILRQARLIQSIREVAQNGAGNA